MVQIAWTTPPTFVSGNALTAAQMNILGDDLLETAAGKATSTGRIFVSTGANTIAERVISQDSIAANNGLGDTSYANFSTNPGPAVTVTTGTSALLFIACHFESAVTSGITGRVSVAISGDTTLAASDVWCVRAKFSDTGSAGRFGITHKFSGNLTAGSNTFTMQGRVSSSSATFGDRTVTVLAL